MDFSEQLIQASSQSNFPSWIFFEDLLKQNEHAQHEEAMKLATGAPEPDTIGPLLEREVARRRLCYLRSQRADERAAPYNHSDLSSIEVDSHGLVDMNSLAQPIGGFGNSDHVFEFLPALPARNSSYWTAFALSRLRNDFQPKIRLDPFMCTPREGYRSVFYRMDVFGQPLTWEKILSLRNDSIHRWMPDQPERSEVAFTDAVWTPRDNEIHLRCEECPKPATAAYRASRYFHTIIDRKSAMIRHCDGAIRIFETDEATARIDSHVRDAGKIGTRIKLFQLDGALDAKLWMRLFSAFFVWNYDIQKFLRQLCEP